MPVLYFSLDANFSNCKNVKEIIAKIDAIILELLGTALKSVRTGNFTEYKVDDGQSITNVIYRSPKEVTDTIREYRKIRQAYANDILGHQFKQVDGRNLNRGGCR